LENTIKLVTRVEKTHRNLGLPVLFTKLVDLSDLGLFICAGRGRGKTTVLKAVEALRHRDVSRINILTWAGIAKLESTFSDRSLTVVNYDFSSFYTDYLKDIGISLMANLITEHRVEATTGRYKIEIQNCYLSFLSAAQPQMLRKLSKIPTWESMYKDRFLRLFMIYPFGTPRYTKDEPQVGTFTIGQAANDVGHIAIPRSVREDRAYERVKALIMRQTSEGRCEMYVERLLRAHAYFNNRDIVNANDLKVLELLAPYLLIDNLLSLRADVSSSLVLDANSYMIFDYLLERGAASRKQIREYFKVGQTTIVKNMDMLMSMRLVRGTYGADEFRIDPTWYTKYIIPIQKWAQETGVYK